MLTIFSPNMLKTYQTCPQKFFLQYIKRVNIPRLTTPFEKGKKIHALANYYLQKTDISRIENALTIEEAQIWKTLQQNTFFQMKCIKSEFQLSCKLSDFWIGGRLDALMQEGGKYYILDYKTGSTPKNPQYDIQTMVYLLCLDCYIKDYESISFVYLNLKHKNNTLITFNEELKLQYQKALTELCSKINNDKTYMPNTQNCSSCEYKTLCKHTIKQPL